MPLWDVVMLLALLFTATVTPYQLSFLQDPVDIVRLGESDGPLGLFIANRTVDLLFILDMVLCFRLMYFDRQTGHWVLSAKKIAWHYLRGWFIIDVLSVLPFYVLPWVIGDGYSPLGSAARIVRLTRFLRLARIFKTQRILDRQLQDLLMGHLELTYSSLTLLQMVLALLIWSHWQACLWYMLPALISDNRNNWISEFEASFVCENQREPCVPGPGDAYAAALYFSVMTITSVGYGQMLPLNTAERIICSTLMMFSGLAWTYIIAQTAGVLSTLNPDAIIFRNSLDDLNHFMRDRRLPRSLRHGLRDYFHNARHVHKANGDARLLAKLSPLLQAQVALEANRAWLEQIWCARAKTPAAVLA